MDDKVFQALWTAALENNCRGKYINEKEDVLTKTFRTPAKRQEELGKIWDVAHMSVREMIDRAGLNQSSFARRFCVPVRTVQNWCSDSGSGRDCPSWAKLGFARQLDMI